jgi:hypothetical protein
MKIERLNTILNIIITKTITLLMDEALANLWLLVLLANLSLIEEIYFPTGLKCTIA